MVAMGADDERRLRREQRERARREREAARPAAPAARRAPRAAPRRGMARAAPTAEETVYRRRRLGGLAVLAAALLAFVLGASAGGNDGGPTLSSQERLLAERAEDPIRFTASASGDLLIHSPVWAQAIENGGGAYDFAPFFTEIRPYVAGVDLGICHFETPLGPDPPASYPIFKAPEELADAVKSSGWDVCDTASNHSLDQGLEGIGTTAAALDRRGIAHTGSFASARSRAKVTMTEVEGIPVALIAYTDATNGIPLPAPYAVNVASPPRRGPGGSSPTPGGRGRRGPRP